jgi:selenocysteine-specific elongation factor
MPQTREHLAILDLLQIQAGVVAITKIDLAPSVEWLDLIEADLRLVLKGSTLEDAPMVRVSARNRVGLDELQGALAAVLERRPPRPDLGLPRLPIDRVFSISGFGTVVTGTLLGGSLQIGDAVEAQPAGVSGRVRGLQNHEQKAHRVEPGARTAVNVSGVDVNQLSRGDVLGLAGSLTPTGRLDVYFQLLADASQPLGHNSEVKLFIGAAERLVRVRLLGAEEIRPGEKGWLQLESQQPLVAQRGDRYILRRPSPGETLGGGHVLDPFPQGRHKRFSAPVLDRLAALTQGTPAELLEQILASLGAAPAASLVQKAQIEPDIALEALQSLVQEGKALELGQENWVAQARYWTNQSDRVRDILRQFHEDNPLRAGLSREALKSQSGLSNEVFNLLCTWLVSQGDIRENGPLIQLASHKINLEPVQQAARDNLLARFAAAPFSPPSLKDCRDALGEPLLNLLLAQEELVALSPDVVFRSVDFEQAVADVRARIEADGSISLATMRDLWGTSRKYVQPLLEAMDAKGITIRDGDIRRLRQKP